MEFSEKARKMLNELAVDFEELTKQHENDEIDENLAMTVFQKEISMVLRHSVETLYSLVKMHHAAQAFDAYRPLKETKTLRDYYDNLCTLQSSVNRLVDNNGKEKSAFVANMLNLENFDLREWYQNCLQFSEFLNNMVTFFGTAIVVSERVGAEKNKNYYKTLSKQISSMTHALNNGAKKLDCFSRGDGNEAEIYMFIQNYFNDSAEVVLKLIEHILVQKNIERKTREAQKTSESFDKSKVVILAKDDKDVERLNVILEANMLYDELCSGTLKDLENQAPYSVREMYDYFVNVKFANFVKNFAMPLDNSTKLSVAKEAIRQINELNNYVTRISENASTTNIYMMKE